MKLFGSITELVAAVFRKDGQAITLRPNQGVTYSASRDIQTPPQNADSVLVSENASQTLTNKTLTSPTINTPTLVVLDSGLTIQDNVDPTKQAVFQASGISTGTTRSYTFPDNSGTLITSATGVDLSSSQTLTNKSLVDASTFIVDDGDATKKLQFQVSGITTGTTRTLTVPDASDTIVTLATTQSLTNKTLDNTNAITVKAGSFTVQDTSNATKLFVHSVSGATAGTTTTLGCLSTTSRSINLPDASTTLVGTDNTATLTNKTLSGNTAVTLISGSGTLTLNTSGTVTLPNATDTLVGKATTDVLTNKDLTATSNSYRAATSAVDGAITTGTQSIGGRKDFTTGITFPNGGSQLDYFLTGSFTATFTQSGGFSQAVAVTYQRIGNLVILNIPTFNASATASATLDSGATDVPAAARPAIQYRAPAQVAVNTVDVMGVINVTTTGQISIGANLGGGNFTSGQNARFGGGGTTIQTVLYRGA
jgi:hypothetical protein